MKELALENGMQKKKKERKRKWHALVRIGALHLDSKWRISYCSVTKQIFIHDYQTGPLQLKLYLLYFKSQDITVFCICIVIAWDFPLWLKIFRILEKARYKFMAESTVSEIRQTSFKSYLHHRGAVFPWEKYSTSPNPCVLT